jgi:acyl dehydratase
MALNAGFVGRRYSTDEPYVVGREKVREFAAAIDESNQACFDLDAARSLGYPDLVAPPTFPMVLTYRVSASLVGDPELGLDYSRVVHGEQHFAYTRPIVAGDELNCVLTIADIRQAAGNDIITTQTQITSITGEPVCVATSTLVARGTAGEE